MKIDIVEFEECESVYGMYINGSLRMSGDYYHDSMRSKIDGYITGVQDCLGVGNVQVKFYSLTEDSQQKFVDDGWCSFPAHFPFTEYTYG